MPDNNRTNNIFLMEQVTGRLKNHFSTFLLSFLAYFIYFFKHCLKNYNFFPVNFPVQNY